MTDALRLELLITGQDGASKQIVAVEKSIERLGSVSEKTTNAIKTSFEALNRVFEDLSASIRASGAAFGEAASAIKADAGRMARAVTSNLEEIKTAASGAFAGIATGATEGTDAAISVSTKMRSAILGDFDTIKAGSSGLFASMADAAASAADATIASLAKIDGAMQATVARMQAAVTEMRAAAAETTAGGGVAGTGAALASQRSGRHGGMGSMHYRVGTAVPLGHASGSATPGLIAGGIGLYSVLEAAKTQDDATRAAITSGAIGNVNEIRKILMDAASSTGYSIDDVSDAYAKTLQETRGLALPDQQALFKQLLPYAATEARMKKTGLAESQESIVSLSHMAGIYDPKRQADLAKQFSYYSLSTTASLPQFAKTLSYSLPELRSGLGMDPGTIMAMTALTQNAGINSTKSGTWLRSFYEGAEPTSGPKAKAHNDALRKLGLLNEKDEVTWRKNGADGKTDWSASTIAIGQAIKDNLSQLPIDQRLETIKKAFGERGGGIASLMSTDAFLKMLPEMMSKLQGSKAGTDAIEDYSKNSTVQQARETWRDTQNLLIKIGNTALPAVNTALRDLDEVLKQLPADWEATKKLWTDRVEKAKELITGERPSLTPEGAALPDIDKQTLLQNLRGVLPPSDSEEDRATRAKASDADPWWRELEQRLKESVWQFGSLDNSAEVLKSSFDGLAGSLGHLAGGSGNDTLGGSPGGDGGTGSGGSLAGGGAGRGSGGRRGTSGSSARAGRGGWAPAAGGIPTPGAGGGIGGRTNHVSPVLLSMIHRASQIAGVPLSVVSGYRSPAYNRSVGGAQKSLHMRGWASDLTSPGHGKGDGRFWAGINRALGQAACQSALNFDP